MNGSFLTTLIFGLWVTGTQAELKVSRAATYLGIADASAAVALNSEFFAVADNKENRIHLYRREGGGPSIQTFDFDPFLDVEAPSTEADLEGAARVGNRVYWIGSHSRNKDGRKRPNRRRFFATDLSRSADGKLALVPVGRPYKKLLADFNHDPRLKPYRLQEAAELEPESAGGLNIEALCSTPEGHLLIGFRNPVPQGKALLVVLLNPDSVITESRAAFGQPMLLDLDGLGIRDMAYADGKYVILAGSYQGGGRSKLFLWEGGVAPPWSIGGNKLKGFNAEALVIYPDTGMKRFQLLSDDGRHQSEGTKGKSDFPSGTATFRAVWIKP